MKEHITRLKINNFKKFEHIVVDNIGQINLVSGDNNVGKTTLLEALLFSNDNLQWIAYLHLLLNCRGIVIQPKNVLGKDIKFPEEVFLKQILFDLKKPLEVRYFTEGEIEKVLGLEYKSINELEKEDYSFRKDNYPIQIVEDWIMFYKDGKKDELQWLYYDGFARYENFGYWPLIRFGVSYDFDLHNYINFKSNPSELDYTEKRELIKYLNLFIPGVLDYDLKSFGEQELIGIATENNKAYRPLTEYGDGVQKFFRYAVEILQAKKRGISRLMIDEIDTGVHYLKMKDEWKAIFELVKQTGIQLFATTHSLECIKSFVDAGEEMGEMKEKLRLIEIEEWENEGQRKNGTTTFNFDTLKFKLETDTNVRGGNVWQ